jgi:hypothetical protein
MKQPHILIHSNKRFNLSTDQTRPDSCRQRFTPTTPPPTPMHLLAAFALLHCAVAQQPGSGTGPLPPDTMPTDLTTTQGPVVTRGTPQTMTMPPQTDSTPVATFSTRPALTTQYQLPTTSGLGVADTTAAPPVCCDAMTAQCEDYPPTPLPSVPLVKNTWVRVRACVCLSSLLSLRPRDVAPVSRLVQRDPSTRVTAVPSHAYLLHSRNISKRAAARA